MSIAATLPRITRKAIAGGKAFRYENATTGKVVTARSKRKYEFASAYRVTALDRQYYGERGIEEGTILIWLHARADLAAKGSPDANRILSYERIPGVIEIEEV